MQPERSGRVVRISSGSNLRAARAHRVLLMLGEHDVLQDRAGSLVGVDECPFPVNLLHFGRRLQMLTLDRAAVCCCFTGTAIDISFQLMPVQILIVKGIVRNGKPCPKATNSSP